MRYLLLVALLVATPASAQTPVVPWADVLSYGTAAVNPAVAVYKAARSGDAVCQLSRFGVSEVIGNAVALAVKRWVHSPRPCTGCAPDGMPSGHTMNSAIGFTSSGWQVGLSFTLATAELRTAANRHTQTQVAAGAALGILSELAGHAIVGCK